MEVGLGARGRRFELGNWADCAFGLFWAAFGFSRLALLAASSWPGLGSLTWYLASPVSVGLVPISLVFTVAL